MKKDQISQAMLCFSFFGKISPSCFQKIISFFPDATQALGADIMLLEKSGLKPKTALEFQYFRKNFQALKEIEKMAEEGIEFTHIFAADYPKILKEIHAAPLVLYYRGKISPWPENSLAIIGSRQPSYYGEKALEKLLSPFISSNLAIISGLALGIDGLAHQKALKNKNATFAILGGGVGKKEIYPPENYALSEKIIQAGGALISEFAPGTKLEKFNFPRRNRIIAGLVKAVLIIEAGKKSGSLITAQCALDENRDVLAVPGSIFSELSLGTNRLIASGAKIINNSNDILEYFPELSNYLKNDKQTEIPNHNDLSNEEQLVYLLIKNSANTGKSITSDEILHLSKLDSALINSTLSILEISGMIKKDGPAFTLS